MENKNVATTASIGIPGVVVGVLVALKHIGMTTLSYWDIIVFGIQVWLVCALIAIAIYVIALLIISIFSS